MGESLGKGPGRASQSRRHGAMSKTHAAAADRRSRRKGPRGRRFYWQYVAILGVIATVAAALSFWWRPAPAAIAAMVDVSVKNDSDLVEPTIVNPGYLGPQACAACHADRVAEFLTTNHFHTFRKPEARTMPVGFSPGHGSFTSRESGLQFEMTCSGSDYFQTAISPDPAAEKRTRSRIDFVLGAGGKADEVYLSWHDDRLYELPMAWLFDSNQWGSSHFSMNGSPEGSRELTVRCLECHNTWFAHVPGTLNQYQPESFIKGVTCEKCHGPGREHVAFHEARPEADFTQGIVRPARLTRERKLDLCTQCHSNSTMPRGPALQYRPGEPLDAYYKTLQGPQHTEDDHVANQIKYLRQSKCFQNSDNMTCTTCHDPHRREPPGRSGLDSCLKCHEPVDCGERVRLPEAVQTNCVGCHMPQYIKLNVNFETEGDNYFPPIRRCDHRIAIHPRAQQEVLLGWHRQQSDAKSLAEAARLTQSLVDEWLAEAADCLKDFRILGAVAAYREAYRLDPAPATREKIRKTVAIRSRIDRELTDATRLITEQRYPEAIELLKGLLPLKPDYAKIHGKLGLAYASLGQRQRAVKHLQAVATFDPDDPYGMALLGWLAYLDDRAEEAAAAYRQADEISPFIAKINYPWSLSLAKLGRWDEAAERFRHVLAINPYHAGGYLGLADALRQQGRPA